MILPKKQTVAFDDLADFVDQQLAAMTPRLLEAARNRNKENEYYDIETLEELKTHIETCKKEDKVTGFVLNWLGRDRRN